MRASFFVTCAAAVLMTSIDAVKFNKVDAYEPLSNLAEIDSSISTLVEKKDKKVVKKSKTAKSIAAQDGGFAAEMGTELSKPAKPDKKSKKPAATQQVKK